MTDHSDTPDTPPPPLTLDAGTMRRLGHEVVDRLVGHLADADRRVARRGRREELAARLDEPPPEGPRELSAVLDRLERDVLPYLLDIQHPRFFGYVPGPSNWIGVLAGLVAGGRNTFAGTWLGASGPAQLELTTVRWLAELCGLPPATGGLFTSGGSMANLTALHVARDRAGDAWTRGVVYFSDQTHGSVARALRVLGFAPDAVRRLPADAEGRLPVEALAAAVAADRAAGRLPLAVVANAGTTNCGAVDPLPALAAFCRAEGVWLHVDGAYGAAAAITARGRAVLAGIEAADSLTLDPHKWLFQPLDVGCVLVRDAEALRAAFHERGDYLRDVGFAAGEVSFCDYGFELSRPFRALKLWLTIQVFGLAALRRAVDRGLDLAERAQEVVEASDVWELATPARLALLTFRWRPPGLDAERLDAVHEGLVEDLVADGSAFLSSTVLGGRTVLRLATINPRATEDDVRYVLARLDTLARRRLAAL